jgi:MFS family permease
MQEPLHAPGNRFSALNFRDFRLFLAGQIISFSGTWMHSTAQGWLVYSLTKSPFYLGVVAAASSLPILLFSLIGGVAADRFRKRNLLLLTQGLSIIPALIIGILADTGAVMVWHVIAMGFLLGTINAFDIPTRQSFLIEMVERGGLLNAIALNSAAFNGARMIGPVLAGFIIAKMGIAACFYLNAISYMAVVGALSMIRAKGEQRMGGGNILGDVRTGMGFILREPSVRRPMMLVAAFSLFGLPFISQLPVFAEEILGAGARGLGLLIGASGVGALAAALTLAVKGDLKDKEGMMGAASVLFPVSLMVFSASRSMGLSLALMATAGLAVVGVLALANSTIQLNTPDGLRGRVMSVYTLVFLGMAPVGHSVMGTAADSIGSARAVGIAAAICLGVSVVIIAMTRRSRRGEAAG